MIGTRLAHFQITSHLGSGGMDDVYEATDLKLGRSVAIKILPEAFAGTVPQTATILPMFLYSCPGDRPLGTGRNAGLCDSELPKTNDAYSPGLSLKFSRSPT